MFGFMGHRDGPDFLQAAMGSSLDICVVQKRNGSVPTFQYGLQSFEQCPCIF